MAGRMNEYSTTSLVNPDKPFVLYLVLCCKGGYSRPHPTSQFYPSYNSENGMVAKMGHFRVLMKKVLVVPYQTFKDSSDIFHF